MKTQTSSPMRSHFHAPLLMGLVLVIAACGADGSPSAASGSSPSGSSPSGTDGGPGVQLSPEEQARLVAGFINTTGWFTVAAAANVSGGVSASFSPYSEVTSCNLTTEWGWNEEESFHPAGGVISFEFRPEVSQTSVPRLSFADRGSGYLVGGIASTDGGEWSPAEEGERTYMVNPGSYLRVAEINGEKVLESIFEPNREPVAGEHPTWGLLWDWTGAVTENFSTETETVAVKVICVMLPTSIQMELGADAPDAISDWLEDEGMLEQIEDFVESGA